jgi:hypothetical protein
VQEANANRKRENGKRGKAMPMPVVAAWTLGMAGAALLAKLAAREWRRVNATLHPQRAAPEAEPIRREQLKTLRRDPRTGIYRVE